MLFALQRPRSGFVASVPDEQGQFALSIKPESALRFWTRAKAEQFKAAHRPALGGGWKIVAAGWLAGLLRRK